MEVGIWIRCNSNTLPTWGLRFYLGRIPRCFWFCRNRIVNLVTKKIKVEIEIYLWYVQWNYIFSLNYFLSITWKHYLGWICFCFSVWVLLLGSEPMLLNFWISVLVGLNLVLGWCDDWSLMFWKRFPADVVESEVVPFIPTPEEPLLLCSSFGVTAWEDCPDEQLSLQY